MHTHTHTHACMHTYIPYACHLRCAKPLTLSPMSPGNLQTDGEKIIATEQTKSHDKEGTWVLELNSGETRENVSTLAVGELIGSGTDGLWAWLADLRALTHQVTQSREGNQA